MRKKSNAVKITSHYNKRHRVGMKVEVNEVIFLAYLIYFGNKLNTQIYSNTDRFLLVWDYREIFTSDIQCRANFYSERQTKN